MSWRYGLPDWSILQNKFEQKSLNLWTGPKIIEINTSCFKNAECLERNEHFTIHCILFPLKPVQNKIDTYFAARKDYLKLKKIT